VLAMFSKPSTAWIRDFIREAQLIIPVLAALAYVPVAVRRKMKLGTVGLQLRHREGQFSKFMLLTCAGIGVLSFYNFFFVYRFGIGHWYAPISTVFMSLFAMEVVQRCSAMFFRRGRLFTMGAMVVFAALTLTMFIKLHRIVGYNFVFADFCYDKAPRLRAHYGGSAPKIVDNEDGIIAFATGFPAMSGQRLAVDRAALDEAEVIGWPGVVNKRGFHRFASLYYLDGSSFQVGDRSKPVRDYANSVLKSRNLDWNFVVEYVDGRFAIIHAIKPPATSSRMD
jgi:hypothetical protein